jgi:heat shock protein HtpX
MAALKGKTQMWNAMKTTILMSALMGLALGIGYLLGGSRALLPALIIGGAMNILTYFFSDKLALATMQAHEVGPGDDPELYEIVRRLAQQAGLPMPKVYVSAQPAPNAFATGRGPRHSAVCVTAGLRQMLNNRELEGVIAHELSHVKHRDILIGTIAAVVAGAISYLGYMAMFFGGGPRDDERGSNPLVALLLLILAPIAAMFIQLAISRSREYAADEAGARLTGSPRGLASALQKLEYGNSQIPTNVPPAQSNMFIVAPLTGKEMAGLFMTHPPIEKRIAKLMAMDRQA